MSRTSAQAATVWRQKKRGKAHRRNPKGRGVVGWWSACYLALIEGDAWEEVPLSRVAPEDLCKRCWRPS